jgi:hypothetical protein
MLDLDLLFGLDPSAFFEEAFASPPDDWQRTVLRSDVPRLLINAGRQVGKSTAVAARAYWTARFRAPALVLLASPSLRQSQELYRKVQGIHRVLGDNVPLEAETATTLTFSNGSRIVSLPDSPDTVRGYSGAALVILDEASRISDELVAALRPTLATSGGGLIALSTPAGRRGWWADAWVGDASSPWQRIEVKTAECRRVPASFLEEERAALGPALYAQEYECAFMEGPGQVFSEALIAGLFSREVSPMFEDAALDLPPAIAARVLPSADVAVLADDSGAPTFEEV